jgi:hypothetical protein
LARKPSSKPGNRKMSSNITIAPALIKTGLLPQRSIARPDRRACPAAKRDYSSSSASLNLDHARSCHPASVASASAARHLARTPTTAGHWSRPHSLEVTFIAERRSKEASI